MFVSIDLPDDWTFVDEDHQTVALSPGSSAERPLVLVAWGAMVGATGDDGHLWRRLLSVGLGDLRLETGEPEPRVTDRGWRFTERRARVLAGERLVEERLAVVYEFDEWRGTALVRIFDPQAGAALAATVRAALAAAVPDWRSEGEIVCLAHLYEEP